MKPEIWVAIYAAIVGSCALLLNLADSNLKCNTLPIKGEYGTSI